MHNTMKKLDMQYNINLNYGKLGPFMDEKYKVRDNEIYNVYNSNCLVNIECTYK